MKNLTTGILLGLCSMASISTACAQVNAADSVMSHAGGHRLSVGGYGEVALSRNFYRDNVLSLQNIKTKAHTAGLIFRTL